jgi:hypothetical protein
MTNAEIQKLVEEYLKTNKITKVPQGKRKKGKFKTFNRAVK